MTLLVYEDLALDAFEALSSETPDPVVAEGAERLPVEPLSLEDVTVDLVHLAPPPRAPPVDAPVLAVTELAGAPGQPGEHVDGELRVLVNLVQADGLVQLHLALDDEGSKAVKFTTVPLLKLMRFDTITQRHII